VHVVGERFNGFAREHPEVTTLPELERMLQDGTLPSDTTVIIGQGISDERLRSLRERIESQDPRTRVTLETDPRALERADSRLTHKHQVQNIMISIPEQVVEGERYAASLLLDDRCAEMSDHVTGQHIQGMVLIEAARQMLLAVTERHFLQEQRDRSNYYVINQLDTTFHSFGFPLGLDIEQQILSRKEGNRGSLSFEAKITLIQGGELLAEVKARYSVYDAAFLSTREAAKARQTLARVTQPQSKTG
jgi:hypothetical protein